MLSEGLALGVFDDVYRIGPALGQGGEGTVYSVVDESGTPAYALKWYHPHTAETRRWTVLNDLVDRGAPSEAFLWPLAVIGSDDGGQFGYVMDLRPPDYHGLAALLSGQVERSDRAAVRAGFDLASGFFRLHTRGLCYRDINFGNVFLRATDGRVLICDNDNVSVDGDAGASVEGTPRFMAPEIVRGAAGPSITTDHFSLAVLLFYLFMVGHPLEGRLTEAVLADDDAHQKFHGFEPLFCFDPHDNANRPDPDFHAHVAQLWWAHPKFIRDLFERSFTVGLHDPQHGRVLDSQWCEALIRLRDCLMRCPSCGDERYLDPAEPTAECPWCETVTVPPLCLELLGLDHRILLTRQASLTRHHFELNLDLDEIIAEVDARPGDPTRLGLRNLSDQSWTFLIPGENPAVLAPGRAVELVPGLRIEALGETLDVVELATV